MKMNTHTCVLTLDVTAKGITYVVLEGPERLFDWGAVKAKDKSKNAYLDRAERLHFRYLPHVLVLEDPKGKGSRRGPRTKAIIARLELSALSNHLPVFKVSRGDVQAAFRGVAKTKQEIAEVISNRFPELIDLLPPPRRAWDSEADNMALFDAISFALAAFRNPEKRGEIEA